MRNEIISLSFANEIKIINSNAEIHCNLFCQDIVIINSPYKSCLKDETGVLQSATTMSISWHDDNLNWTGIQHHDYYKNFAVHLPKSYIWTPDITVWNSAGANSILKLKNDSILRVYSSGLVSAKISSILDTECDLLLYT